MASPPKTTPSGAVPIPALLLCLSRLNRALRLFTAGLPLRNLCGRPPASLPFPLPKPREFSKPSATRSPEQQPFNSPHYKPRNVTGGEIYSAKYRVPVNRNRRLSPTLPPPINGVYPTPAPNRITASHPLQRNPATTPIHPPSHANPPQRFTKSLKLLHFRNSHIPSHQSYPPPTPSVTPPPTVLYPHSSAPHPHPSTSSPLPLPPSSNPNPPPLPAQPLAPYDLRVNSPFAVKIYSPHQP